MSEEKKSVYNLDIHEWINIRDLWHFTDILRVPGGWIYYNKDLRDGRKTAVFVPFDNEFQRK